MENVKTLEDWKKQIEEVNDFQAPGIDDTYGYELVVDLKNCDRSKFNRKDLEEFCIQVCELTKMRRADLHFWDCDNPEQYKLFEEKAPHLCGTSLCQFIMTSNIIVHTIDPFNKCYINLFTCKPFEPSEALEFIKNYFSAEVSRHTFLERI